MDLESLCHRGGPPDALTSLQERWVRLEEEIVSRQVRPLPPQVQAKGACATGDGDGGDDPGGLLFVHLGQRPGWH